ncbi:MAG: hypothetical protein ACK5NB_13350 [Flavobacteriaceae bacterium]
MNCIKIPSHYFLIGFLCINIGFGQGAVELKKAPEKHVFLQADFSFPISANADDDSDYSYYDDGDDWEPWFIPVGINASFGAGVHYNKWIALSVNTGISTSLEAKLATVPVFANLKLMPRISHVYFGADIGFGKSMALGRGKLSGIFQRYKLFFGSDEVQLFLEAQLHGYDLHGEEAGNICVGISISNFL